ncbi:MAG: L,D-transpeptidase family protein [Beijerinckiaceae bacterium]
MKRILSFAGPVLAALVLSQPVLANPYAQSGQAASAASPNLGGGFIELLLTGRNPAPRGYAQPQNPPAVQPQPYPASQGYGAAPVYRALPVEPYQPQARTQPEPRQAALNPDFRQVERGLDPQYLPQTVDYSASHSAGTVVIDTSTKFLYLVEGQGKARRYGIGVGRPGFEWKGSQAISRKAEWPDWRPPAEMLKRRPDLPRYMAGGPENPMGARGLYLGSSLYRIHGTNEPHTIGQAVSSGCIRMRNEDVTELYERVRVGTKVIVM